MKFTEHLASHLTPEWRSQYIDYEGLKLMLENYEPVPNDASFSILFLETCEKELIKIDNFYMEKVAEAKRKFTSFLMDYKNYKILRSTKKSVESEDFYCSHLSKLNPWNKNKRVIAKTFEEIKLFASELYFGLALLQNYQTLNQTGFRKILKKHDKLIGNSIGGEWFDENIAVAKFALDTSTTKLTETVEQFYIDHIQGGNRSQAMKKLRVPPLNDNPNPFLTFRVGLYLGVFIVEVAIIVFALIYVFDSEFEKSAEDVFRDTFLIIVFMSLISFNIWGWRVTGVNHVLIFELDPRDHMSPFQLMEHSLMFAVLWGICMIYYLFSKHLFGFAYIGPLVMGLSMVLYLFLPFNVLEMKARLWFLKVLKRIVCSPLWSVKFADFWLADQLTSLVVIYPDFFYVTCRYSSELSWSTGEFKNMSSTTDHRSCISITQRFGPILRSIPFVFRFLQCIRRYYDQKERNLFPHLFNAGKYSTAIPTMIGAYLLTYLSPSYSIIATAAVLFFVTMIIRLIWDIFFDWSLYDTKSNHVLYLREERVFNEAWYHVIAIQNIILRFSWIYSLLVARYDVPTVTNRIMHNMLPLLEVYRRFMWNFIRLENEHLNNVGEFRAVRDISITNLRDKLELFPSLVDYSLKNQESPGSLKDLDHYYQQIKELRNIA